jgi:uncharacterized membrane protein YfcA
MDWTSIWLAIVALGAATINGAIGYGFSSIVTPIALLWISPKVLNPAIVSVELLVNVSLLYRERAFISATKARALPVAKTLLPGVLIGTIGLTFLAVLDVKLVVYLLLLPLVAVQLLGLRRPFSNERQGGYLLGPGIGFLYALTTISGPPLAIFFRNQGLTKNEFRCTLAQVRVAESSLTLVTYGLFTEFLGANLLVAPSLAFVPYLLIPVLIGIPLGGWIMSRVSRDLFTRFVMAMDGLVITFGLSQVFVKLKWLGATTGYLLFAIMAAVIGAVSVYALYRLPGSRKLVDSQYPEGKPPPPGNAPTPPAASSFVGAAGTPSGGDGPKR